MTDQSGRCIDYMRVSITDRCNLRCRYCMPEGIRQLAMPEILTYEEIKMVCTQAVRIGIDKIKITGGEPLVRKGCVDLIRMIKEIPGIRQVTITTNGVLLEEYLEPLKRAGVDGINISLDTVDKDKYREITGTDACELVQKAVVRAAESGIPTKINTVLQGMEYIEEWKGLLEFSKRYPVDIRFIELMPIGSGKKAQGVSNIELLKEIQKVYPDIQKDKRIHGNGPAVYYQIPGYLGSVGFISALHGKFCDHCNRIRLTSTGNIKPCLCYGKVYPLRQLLRSGTEEQVRREMIKAINDKPAAHCFDTPGAITEQRQMAQIGG